MTHEIHRVTDVEVVEAFTLRVTFEDGTSQVIDFRPVLHGEIYGPLRDKSLFDQVQIDSEAHTLVWPNGADFDPAILYNWPEAGPEMANLAKSWVASTAN